MFLLLLHLDPLAMQQMKKKKTPKTYVFLHWNVKLNLLHLFPIDYAYSFLSLFSLCHFISTQRIWPFGALQRIQGTNLLVLGNS